MAVEWDIHPSIVLVLVVLTDCAMGQFSQRKTGLWLGYWDESAQGRRDLGAKGEGETETVGSAHLSQ